MWHVYILLCGNGTYYVGHTCDMTARYKRHAAKTGARHTAQNHIECLVYSESFDSEADAISRERQLKKWSRAKKQALILSDFNKLRALSHSREPKRT